MARNTQLIVLGLIIFLIIGIIIGYSIPKTVSSNVEYAYPLGKFTNPPASNKDVVILYGFDPDYPPFTKVLPNGTAIGLDVDVIKWIAGKYGWKVVFKPWDWSTIVDALVRGDIDVIASGMTVTEARSEKIWFSIPYYTYAHVVLVKVGDDRSLEEILNSGGYIAVQTGSTADEWAEKLLDMKYNFKKLGLNSYPEALQALLDDRAVAVISDSAFIYPYLKRNPDIANEIKVLSTIGPTYVYAIATRPEDRWLRNMINKALEELMNSPEWNRLLEKWGLE